MESVGVGKKKKKTKKKKSGIMLSRIKKEIKKRIKKKGEIFPSQSKMMDASVMCKMNQVCVER